MLICERDTKFTARFVLSIKSECLNRMIFFGEASLRRAVREYVAHYQQARAHQALDNGRVEPGTLAVSGDVERVERLVGILKHYRRAA